MNGIVTAESVDLRKILLSPGLTAIELGNITNVCELTKLTFKCIQFTVSTDVRTDQNARLRPTAITHSATITSHGKDLTQIKEV